VAVVVSRSRAASELRRFIEEEASDFPAVQWVWEALGKRGKLLAPDGGFAWGLMPLVVCEAVGGDPDAALPLGVALECFMAAADIFDDVEDGDDPGSLWFSCGTATDVNVGVFLLCLSQVAISRLSGGPASAAKVAEISRLFASSGARACGGQQMDLDSATDHEIDEGRYLVAAAHKSASLVECACRVGAILGTDGERVVDAMGAFGLNVGMAMQITNDVMAVSTHSERRNDLRLGKRTLPVIFSLDNAPDPVRRELGTILSPSRSHELHPMEIARARDLIESGGGLTYATLVADVHWERALDCLESAGMPNAGLIARWVGEVRHA
jgi:geranylgeranyl pyrophosphate synthase